MVSRTTSLLMLAVLVGIAYFTEILPFVVMVPVAVVLAIIALFGDAAARRDDVESGGIAGSVASSIQALGAVLFVGAIWLYVDDPLAFAAENWWLVPLGAVFLFTYYYAQNRRDVASSSTAVRRTRRDVKRNVSDWSSLLLGIGVLILTGAFAILQGFGDALAPFAEEVAYGLTVFIGYVQLGGEAGGWGAWIPNLSALQWVGVTLLLAGFGLFVQSQS